MNVSRYTYGRTRRDDWKIILFALIMMGIGAIIGGLAGVFIFIRITGGSAEASQPISAPTLSVSTFSTPVVVPTIQNEIVPTEIPTIIGGGFSEATPTSVEPVAPQTVIEPTATVLSPQLFRIVSEESEARFSVFETFPLGTAIGRTNQIAGDLIVDFNTPANSQLGTIRINLRTLRTDDADRDRSIRCCVLLTARPEYEFADFVPTSITGLPAQVQLGERIHFQITGDLSLRGVTHPVIFDVYLTVINMDELQGIATGTVNRSDFGILNNSDNGFDYHGVEEEVTLEFDFVARTVPQDT